MNCDAPRMRQLHGWLVLFWALNVPAVFLMPESWRVPYLIIVSIYANVVGHWSSWQAARVEEKQDAVKKPSKRQAAAAGTKLS